MKLHLLKSKILLSTLLIFASASVFAKSVKDTQSLAVAQSVVDFGTTSSVNKELIIIMWPQAWNTSAFTDDNKYKLQQYLVQNLGAYTGTICFSDGTFESQVWDLMKFTGIEDNEQRQKRKDICQKARYAVLPFITTKNGRHAITLTVLDLKTGLRKETSPSKDYPNLEAFFGEPGACNDAIKDFCSLFNIALNLAQKDSLEKKKSDLSLDQQILIQMAYVENAQLCIQTLEAKKTSNPAFSEFYEARIEEKNTTLNDAQKVLANLQGDAERLAALKAEEDAKLSDEEKAKARLKEEQAAAKKAQKEAKLAAKQQKKKEAKEKKDKAKREKQPVQWGQEGQRGIYLEGGGNDCGPDFNLCAIFDLNNFIAVGGSIGLNMLPGARVVNEDLYYEEHYGWNFYKHQNEMPILTTLQARFQAGTSLGIFYFYGLASAGAYLSIQPEVMPGFVAETGIGANARFFDSQFALGLEERVKLYEGLGVNFTTNLILGWHF